MKKIMGYVCPFLRKSPGFKVVYIASCFLRGVMEQRGQRGADKKIRGGMNE